MCVIKILINELVNVIPNKIMKWSKNLGDKYDINLHLIQFTFIKTNVAIKNTFLKGLVPLLSFNKPSLKETQFLQLT